MIYHGKMTRDDSSIHYIPHGDDDDDHEQEPLRSNKEKVNICLYVLPNTNSCYLKTNFAVRRFLHLCLLIIIQQG